MWFPLQSQSACPSRRAGPPPASHFLYWFIQGKYHLHFTVSLVKLFHSVLGFFFFIFFLFLSFLLFWKHINWARKEPGTIIMSINMLLKQTHCVIRLAIFITQYGSENDRERSKHALLVYSTAWPMVRGCFRLVCTQIWHIPAVQSSRTVLCACLSSHLVVNMKHSAAKPHNFALDHVTYIPSPLPSAWGEGREGRKRPPPSRKQQDAQPGCG